LKLGPLLIIGTEDEGIVTGVKEDDGIVTDEGVVNVGNYKHTLS